jgi:hypothetical protein
MRNGSAGIAADVADAGLQQRFADSENAFTVEYLTAAQAQKLHLLLE